MKNRRTLLVALLLFILSARASLFGNKHFKGDSSQISTKLDAFMTELYEHGQFTGAILVSRHGNVIYEKAFGMADPKRKIPFTPDTQEYIGSVSKQMTAMGIMILKERGKLSYGQSVRDYFPELPESMQSVRILDLLRHTGGLEDFYDFPDMTEQDVFRILMKQKTLKFEPGTRFQYSNGGYTLLGMIISKIAGQSLNAFLTENIFRPLKMVHTSVNQITARNKERAIGYDLFGSENNYDSFIGGSASVISTVRDLFKWDESFAKSPLVSAQTLAEAFEPSIVQKDDTYGERSYGFGWWIGRYNGQMTLFHNGSFGGYKAYNEILIGDRINIIHLSNLRHSSMMGIRAAIIDILNGRPYKPVPRSIGAWIYREKQAAGADSMIHLYRQIKGSAAKDGFDFGEGELNTLGYHLMRSERVDDAIKIFTLNTEVYPESANVYDSLGEAYLKSGNKELGLKNYQKALAIHPDDKDLQQRIANIR